MERTYIRFSGCDFCAGRVVETLGDGTVQWGWRPDGEPMGAATFMFERGCKQCGDQGTEIPREASPRPGA
jgi:hypothetical protein